MAREKERAGKVPESSLRGLFWPSHLFRDSIIVMLPFESVSQYLLLLSSFSFFFNGNRLWHMSLHQHFLFLDFCSIFSTKCQTCLPAIFSWDLRFLYRYEFTLLLSCYHRHALEGVNPLIVNTTQRAMMALVQIYLPIIVSRIKFCNLLILSFILIPVPTSYFMLPYVQEHLMNYLIF